MMRFVILMIFVIATAGLWTGGWFYVAGLIQTEIEVLAQADGQTTPRVTCEALEVGGFPFQFAPRCIGAHITAGDYDVTVAEVQGTALFYRPTHIQLFAQSPLRIEDAFTGSIQDINWDTLRASVRLQSDRVERISVVGSQLRYADGLFGEVVFATADQAEIHLVDASETEGASGPGATLDYFLRLDGVQSAPADIDDGAFTLDGRVTGVPSFNALARPDALQSWQANDGTLAIRALDATATGLALNAAGEMALDPQGRLDGSLELSANGVLERFGSVEDDPMMAVLAGTPDEDGTYSQSVSARGGTLLVGIIPVYSLGPLF